MKTKPKAAVAGVNETEKPVFVPTIYAHAPYNRDEREVLLVDRTGNPLIVRQPRSIGFRRNGT
jgi:hypothetical protein